MSQKVIIFHVNCFLVTFVYDQRFLQFFFYFIIFFTLILTWNLSNEREIYLKKYSTGVRGIEEQLLNYHKTPLRIRVDLWFEERLSVQKGLFKNRFTNWRSSNWTPNWGFLKFSWKNYLESVVKLQIRPFFSVRGEFMGLISKYLP